MLRLLVPANSGVIHPGGIRGPGPPRARHAGADLHGSGPVSLVDAADGRDRDSIAIKNLGAKVIVVAYVVIHFAPRRHPCHQW